MCTVTIVRAAKARNGHTVTRIICNRDEQRSRPAELPARTVACGPRLAVMPIDSCAGGTWVAATDAGLALCLLNVNLSPAVPRGAWAGRGSRGHIIPSLADSADVFQAAERLGAMSAAATAPFKLLITDSARVVVARSDGSRIEVSPARSIDGPIMHTSSGLGDDLVQSPRRELFERMFGGAHDLLERQIAFHAHGWPEAGHLSVAMSRADARTMSRTVIELHESSVRLAWTPLDDRLLPACQTVEAELPTIGAGCGT
ncbi:MAG: NRDE family protein [Phycisphaeraceae bacterium]|nr:NRDE family protein [Phycisphaeraceae bacterium]